MGPVVDESLSNWLLRPFQSSQTFQNLQRHPHCIFHTTDNVLQIVSLILGQPLEFEFEPTSEGWLLQSACHWYELEIRSWDTSQPRSEAKAMLVRDGDLRPFWGWNRAKHAVLEATILMTRLHLLDRSYVEQEFDRLAIPVEKTAGPNEEKAWSMLNEHLSNHHWGVDETVGS